MLLLPNIVGWAEAIWEAPERKQVLRKVQDGRIDKSVCTGGRNNGQTNSDHSDDPSLEVPHLRLRERVSPAGDKGGVRIHSLTSPI